MPGIYIHIPFCRQACHYCNFHFSVSQKRRPEFLSALIKEIALRNDFFTQPGYSAPSINTLYIGGGTPSLLNTFELEMIFNAIHKYFNINESAEITLEANPDDLDLNNLQTLKEMGINRLSIGIQSFREADLQYMNRTHSAGQAQQVLKDAIIAGFTNITSDLIYGTPGLSDEMWVTNIMYLIDHGIPHISAYSLTVEKKTALDVFIREGKAAPVDEEQAARQFMILREITSRYGYDHYEISNFGLPGFHSGHNLAYWSGEPYVGFGPSAHSFTKGRRRWNVANTSSYIDDLLQNDQAPFDEETLTPTQQLNEYIMTSLRTMWGMDKLKVALEFGQNVLSMVMKDASVHLKNGNLTDTGTHMVISPKGLFFADGIASDLFQ